MKKILSSTRQIQVLFFTRPLFRASITILPLLFVLSCGNNTETTDALKEKKPIPVKSKEVAKELPPPPPNYSKHPERIDYGLTSDPEDFEQKRVTNKENQRVVAALLSDKQDWEVRLHHRLLGYLRSEYSFSKAIKTSTLPQVVGYSEKELDVLDSAFPSVYVDIASIQDGDTLTLKSNPSSADNDFFDSKSSTVDVQLMNIACPHLEQSGGAEAKHLLKSLVSIADDIKGDYDPKLKIRYRYLLNDPDPLVILTMVFPKYEISLNRSMVYSGACFAYRKYNQDPMLINIEGYAMANKKGVWRDRVKLMASDEWVMPWDFKD